MTRDSHDHDHDPDQVETGRLLDRLGQDAVAEAGPAPAVSTPSGAHPGIRLLAAAVIVLLVAASAAVLVAIVGRDDGEDVVAVPATTAVGGSDDEPVPPTWPTENIVTMTFAPDPASMSDALQVTVTNRSSAPWTFTCAVGTLSKWVDGAWQPVGRSAIWNEDVLRLFDLQVSLDCNPEPLDQRLQPGETQVRTLRPSTTLREGVSPDGAPGPLGPGIYQLLFADRETFTGAVGQFELTPDDDRDAPSTDTTTWAQTTTSIDTGNLAVDGDCPLLSSAEVRELAGVDPASPTGPVTMSPQPCWVGDTAGEATYRVVSAAEAAEFISVNGSADPFAPRPLGGTDDSLFVVMPSGGRGAPRVEGAVVVGDSGVIVTRSAMNRGVTALQSDLVRLATALVPRLAAR